MRVVILPDDEIGSYGAQLVLDELDRGLRVLGVATGSSPLPIYRALRERWSPRLGDLTAFALDEYVGLDDAHPESYHRVIDREVTRPLGLDPERVHVPDGRSASVDDAGDRYESLIHDAGGVDLQILGVGATGHIGFNEPGSSLASRTRITRLTERTRRDNARFFEAPADVPEYAVTQGLGTIMEARRLLLVASGDAKADAIGRLVEGPITSMCPGSVLQLHPDVTVLVDERAAARLELRDHYRLEAGIPGPR